MTTGKKKKRPHIHKAHKGHVGSGAVRSDINITPLVDVVLVLLIIFMVVTPMLHRGPQVQLPETAHHAKKNDTGEQLILTVRADGTYIENDKLEGERLMVRLRQELKATSRAVHVRADRTLRYGDVRKVLEQVHTVGSNTVSLGTDEQKVEGR